MIALVIGGTGTLGKQVIPLLLQDRNIRRVRVMSRGEHEQIRMEETLGSDRIDWLVGDVRDQERVDWAMRGVGTVFNFAAVKSVDKAEYDPWEAVQTNIQGAHHVIRSAITHEVACAVFTSTDKAVAPLNLYGATKLAAEKLWIQGNIGDHRTTFACVRYGNVLGSQGSILDKFARTTEYKITDEHMTRFFMTPKQAGEFVVMASEKMVGGEIFIPKMKSCTLADLLEAYAGDVRYKIIGRRPGEKQHEVLMAEEEVSAGLVTEVDQHYVRWPSHKLFPWVKRGIQVDRPISSLTSERFTISELRRMIWETQPLSPTSAPVTQDDWTTLLRPLMWQKSAASMS